MPLYSSRLYPESRLAHRYLDGLSGIEIGGSYHNAFGVDTMNVDFTADMDTEFKREELAMCGHAMPVDIVAPGDNVPVAAKSFDFVLSSHVIEHFFDPIAALQEWARIARRFIYVICPQPTALQSDRIKPLTSLRELIDRHAGRSAAPPHEPTTHYTRWTSTSFADMCQYFGFGVLEIQDPDDKVGNGFAVVIDVSPVLHRKLERWCGQQRARLRARVIAFIEPRLPR
jgi:SAM-dependent methyltransferase